jgi:carbamoyltransferase
MSDGLILSAYGSHNATIAVYHNEKYHIIELERWLNKKNSGLAGYLPAKYPQKVFDDIMEYIFNLTGARTVDLFLTNYFTKIDFSNYDIKKFQRFDHHMSHAACAFYQSDFTKSLIFTYDGGGNGAFFNVYVAEDRESGPNLIDRFDLDLGFPYMILADHLSDIRKEPLNIGNLVYAGKLMGLCAYGEVNEEWLPHFENFYRRFRYGGNSFTGGAETRISATNELMEAIGVDMSNFNIEETRFEGKFSWDIAATSQQAFENVFLELAKPYLERYKEYPVCLSGGCALNVILNARLVEFTGPENIFVPPNTNDCGIAVGGLLEYNKPENSVDLTYSGLPIMDEINYTSLVETHPVKLIDEITLEDLSKLLANDYIIGVIRGDSEHGPRALGNRSILCNPVGDMKDVLNEKVKNREWYRPFAPVVRLEDVQKYFDFEAESRHMTFIAKVKDGDRFPAITHVDGTGRLQTVTKDQNDFLYNLLEEFEKHSGHGILLNTSFNVNGKPILTRLSDAFEILMNTDLDCIYYDGKIIFKYKRENEFHNLLRFVPISMDHTNYALYIMAYTDDDNEFNKIKPKIDALQAMHSKVFVVVNKRHSGLFKKLENTILIEMDDTKIYYRDMIGAAGFAGNEVEFIKPLWAKDIIERNDKEADYHIVVDLTYKNSFENFKLFYSKYMVEPDLVDNVITDTEDSSNITIKDFLSRKNNYSEIDDTFPRFGVYSGYTDRMSWFLRTYEGNFRYHMLNGRGTGSRDYLAIQYLEHMGSFLIHE